MCAVVGQINKIQEQHKKKIMVKKSIERVLETSPSEALLAAVNDVAACRPVSGQSLNSRRTERRSSSEPEPTDKPANSLPVFIYFYLFIRLAFIQSIKFIWELVIFFLSGVNVSIVPENDLGLKWWSKDRENIGCHNKAQYGQCLFNKETERERVKEKERNGETEQQQQQTTRKCARWSAWCALYSRRRQSPRRRLISICTSTSRKFAVY